ncbi:outer membrane beta-barrel family protein [Parabacteroides sp. OttesenSCG-928-N08]|nr:outer membrane beta-barrel family protein [Parabacteroides sp. OttesenSCG-928-N08]
MKRIFIAIACTITCHCLHGQTPTDTLIHLQSVEIQGQSFSGLSLGEVKRLQIENSATAINVTTAEALNQLPSVVSDIEGGILYRGSTHSGMLLHGIPYGLLEENSGDLLIQLPSLFFNQLSLTATPAIGQVPDGEGGVFNLSSTAYNRQDAPAVITAGAGLQERSNAGAILNLHPGRFHIIGKYNYRQEFRERQFTKTTTNAGGTTEMNNSAAAHPETQLGDLYLGFDASANDLISLYGLYYRMDYNRYGGINNTRYNPAGEIANRMLRHRFNYQEQEAYAVEARWLHTFNNPTDRFELVINYNNFVYNEDNDYKNENPNSGAIVAQDNLILRQIKDNYYLSAGYRKGFSDDLFLHFGFIGRYKEDYYRARAANLKEESWVNNPTKSNTFEFNRINYLLYLALEKNWEHFGGEIGVQAEHTYQKATGTEYSDPEANGREEYSYKLYPRLRMTLQTSLNSSLSLNYQLRANRPLSRDLNPFIDQADASYILQGNPDLRNEFIHSVDLTYELNLPLIRIVPALYYRYKTDRIMAMAYQNGEQTIWKKENMGDSRTIGGELAISWNPLPLLHLGISGNLFRDEIDARNVGYYERKSMICWEAKGYAQVNITPTTELRLDGFYLSDQLTPQGEIKARSSVNVGVAQYLFNRKLRANLSVSNLFDGLEEVTIIDTNALQMRQTRNRDVRVGWLTLTYHF